MSTQLTSSVEPSTSQASATSITSSTDPDSTTEAIYARLLAYDFDADPDYIAGVASILGHPETPPTREELDGNGEFVTRVKCFYFTRKFGLGDVDPVEWARWAAAQQRRDGEGEETGTAGTIGDDNTAGVRSASRPPGGINDSTSTTVPAAVSAPTTYMTLTSPPEADPTAQQQQSRSQEGPPYPLSFSAIVDLITRNVPVPGIETVPDTVLEHGSSKVDHTAKRKKPWEKDGGSGEGAGIASGLSSIGLAGSTPVADGLSSAQQTTSDITGERASNDKIINGHLSTGEGVVKILQPNAIPDSGLLAKE
jgi:hypothetical protein